MKPYDKTIKDHYDAVAKSDKSSASSTMSNNFIRESETNFIHNQIAQFIKKQGIDETEISFIDVGCGNGYTLDILSKKFNFKFSGIELTDSLRSIADERFRENQVSISKGDIRMQENMPKNQYQILLCQRVLINLLDEKDQLNALENLISLVEKGGLMIFLECFNDSMDKLNKLREEYSLEKIKPSHHNLYLSPSIFDNKNIAIHDDSQKNFLSTHYFISRILHPLYLNYNNLSFERNSEFVNNLTKALPPNVNEYSPLKFLSFIKY